MQPYECPLVFATRANSPGEVKACEEVARLVLQDIRSRGTVYLGEMVRENVWLVRFNFVNPEIDLTKNSLRAIRNNMNCYLSIRRSLGERRGHMLV